MGVLYLDASALARWILQESGWQALGALLASGSDQASSRLVEVEVTRAVHRSAASVALRDRASRVLGQVTLIEFDATIAQTAGQIGPPSLRSLDAIHLATCLMLMPEIDALVTYDRRVAEAAASLGLNVASP
jgi:predicted nucleic acid-binding protein